MGYSVADVFNAAQHNAATHPKCIADLKAVRAAVPLVRGAP